jgi:hypothetical protein
MAYIRERMDGTAQVYPRKLRAALRNKVGDLLSRYSIDEVLSEIADQRPTFDIRLIVAPQRQAEGKSA